MSWPPRWNGTRKRAHRRFSGSAESRLEPRVSVMFRFTTAGESHGRGLVAVLEGIPAGLPLSAERVNAELKRRMGGYGRGARMKIEADQIEWLAGARETVARVACGAVCKVLL